MQRRRQGCRVQQLTILQGRSIDKSILNVFSGKYVHFQLECRRSLIKEAKSLNFAETKGEMYLLDSLLCE